MERTFYYVTLIQQVEFVQNPEDNNNTLNKYNAVQWERMNLFQLSVHLSQMNQKVFC